MAKRIIAGLMVTAATMTGVLAATPPDAVGSIQTTAAQRTHRCVDNYEWRNFDIGDGRRYVHRLFDISGYFRWQRGNYQKRVYAHCGRYYDAVAIVYHWNGYSWRVDRARRY